MQIEYSLTESDILALYGYRLRVDPRLRRAYQIRRYLYLIGFGLIGIAAFWFSNQPLYMYCLAAIGILAYAFYPFYVNWRVSRNLEKTYASDEARKNLPGRTLELTDENMIQITREGRSKIDWDDIDDMGVTPSHAFISVAERSSWVIIPRQGLHSGDFDALITEIRRYLEMPPKDEKS